MFNCPAENADLVIGCRKKTFLVLITVAIDI